MQNREIVVSGIRATGVMHIGNYFGVLERFAQMSRDPGKLCFFFIADLHTLTTLKEARLITRHSPNIVLDMLGAGVDPENSVIYRQSSAPQVTELAWYLSCLTPAGALQRLPTFKDKAEKHSDDVNAGLLNYPVLMAADILGPRANLVPVGPDQEPHLEMTRIIARRFNSAYGMNLFPIPDSMQEDAFQIPGLFPIDEDGNFGKMGKSEDESTALFLSDTAEEMRQKIRKAPTDPNRVRREDIGDPNKCVIHALHRDLSSGEDVMWSRKGCQTAGIGCVECKERLAGNINEKLVTFRERRLEFSSRPDRLAEILDEGAKRAQTVFSETTQIVAETMGIPRQRSFK